MHSLSPLAAFLPHTQCTSRKRHTCHLWAHSRSTYRCIPPHTDILSHSYSYPGTHARKFHRLTHRPRQSLPLPTVTPTPTVQIVASTLSPPLGRPTPQDPNQPAQGVYSLRGSGRASRCAARPAVAGRSWGSRGRASRGAARCPAPPPRAAPARPLPGGRRPFHDSAPPAKPPSRVSHRCLESPPGREAILVPPAVETSPSGRRGALKWGRGQA